MAEKQIILQIKNVYTANKFQTARGAFVGAGSETEPILMLYDLIKKKAEQVPDCPGGIMSFNPVPAQPDLYLSIMGLFPPFIGSEAGLYLHQRVSRGWKTEKAMSLPFAHRCESISWKGKNYLVASSVSQYKENPADWSRPGEVHIISLDNPLSLPWKSTLIHNGITRNHGMIKTHLDGKETLCVAGEQGVFNVETGREGTFEVSPLFRKEVSEVNFIDLDGDGTSEMVTIEPFHGSSLNLYKRIQGEWSLIFSDSLAFGHGLSSGLFNGEPVIVVGNRNESLALEIFRVENLSRGIVQRRIIEKEAGPTQTQVFSFKGKDYILSANQKKNEVALYSGQLD